MTGALFIPAGHETGGNTVWNGGHDEERTYPAGFVVKVAP